MANKTKLRLNQISGSLGARAGGNGTQNAFTFAAGADNAIYINMDKFFEGTDTKIDDFKGVGFTLELIKHYGIRGCELGPFAFEWDQKTEEQRKGILNFVRFAVPRNMYGPEHIDYTVAAITELYKNKDQIPKVEVVRGKELHLRHFQSGLKPVY